MQLLPRDTKNLLEGSSQQETKLSYTLVRQIQAVTAGEHGKKAKKTSILHCIENKIMYVVLVYL